MIHSYNKTQDDFDTLREYNDYLEEVETISMCLLWCHWCYAVLHCVTPLIHAVFNLTNGRDMEETRARVDSYRKENQTTIIRNRMRQVCDRQA